MKWMSSRLESRLTVGYAISLRNISTLGDWLMLLGPMPTAALAKESSIGSARNGVKPGAAAVTIMSN